MANGGQPLPSTPNERILLVAGDKSGGIEKRFYKQFIAKADLRFSAHVGSLKTTKKEK